MLTRKGNAVWQGDLMAGKGTVQVGAGRIELPYSFSSRFESGVGSNPEELIAAAHSGCFSMKLAFVLNAAGFTADHIETTCTVTLEAGAITESRLVVQARVPGMEQARFAECAEDAKANCPVSKVLNAAITLEAILA